MLSSFRRDCSLPFGYRAVGVVIGFRTSNLEGSQLPSHKQHQRKTVVDIRLRPRCCPLASHLSVRPVGVAFAWHVMKSSTKPEVHNVLHCRPRRTEPRPQVTPAENLVKFGRVTFKIRVRERTDKQTYTLIAIPHIPTGVEV